jgi:Luciferase-like monooxygenase
MAAPRMCLILSENWTMTSGRDLPRLVRWAREAEDAGFDSVMISEHIVLGPSAGANGIMLNPREYALPGDQDPATPWPSSVVLLSAIAAVTERIRLVAGAVIAPLRHPLLIARELGSLDLLSGGRRHPGRVPRRDQRGRPGPGPGGHPAAGGGRVRHVLHQAVAVHRRPGRRGPPVPGRHPPGRRHAPVTFARRRCRH